MLPKSLPDVRPKVEGGQGRTEFLPVLHQRDSVCQLMEPRKHARVERDGKHFEKAVLIEDHEIRQIPVNFPRSLGHVALLKGPEGSE